MPRAGGEADKLGNQYEAVWKVECALDMVENRFRSITEEALGEESVGVEFHLISDAGVMQFHSVKRQTVGGDWSIAKLCAPDKSTKRSILGDLLNKRRTWPNAELRFVSATGANDLRELTERAKTHATHQDFTKSLSAKLKKEFSRVVKISNDDPETAFAALKSLEVILRSQNDLIRSVENRIRSLFNRIDRSELRPDDVRRTIAEFFLDNLGKVIDKPSILGFLEAKGIGFHDWKQDRPSHELVANANRRYIENTETELINSGQIARSMVNGILTAVLSSASRGALVVAPGGYGKSCVLAQCVNELSSRSIPHLCLRMDSFNPCQTAKQLGEQQMDLRESPAIVLAGIANNQPSVMIVDQLDAMSLISGRNPAMWQVFQDLCEEVRRYPQMRMILACRDFDLEHDHRLRNLSDPKSGFTKFTLGKLTEHEIRLSLGEERLTRLALDAKQFEILGIPFHLLLFLQGDPSSKFTSVGELYDRYWVRKQRNLRMTLAGEQHWNEVIDALTSRMSNQQLLFAPIVVVDNWSSYAQAMASEHVLIEVQNPPRYRFFHESFFDYAYARRFCAKGQSLVELLLSSEQHLFRRAQVRQILTYRREHDFTQYLADVQGILTESKVRFHIKRMVATEFGRYETPKSEEWNIIEPLLLDGELSRYISSAILDHVGWFDLLDRLRVFERWLASNDARLQNAAIWYFEARELHNHRSARIAELIQPYTNRNSEWQHRILRLLYWGNAHKSPAMAQLFLDLVKQGVYDDYKSGIQGGDFWSMHYSAEKECPCFIIDVLANWFDRAVTQVSDDEALPHFDHFSLNNSRTGASMVCDVATKEPTYFLEHMLPLAINGVLKTQVAKNGVVLNRIWRYLSNIGHPFQVDDAVLISIRRSLQYLAKNDVCAFQKHAATLTNYPHQTFGYWLLSAWAENPNEFADECARYIIADEHRLNIGYEHWINDNDDENKASGKCAISRIALRAISPRCSAELFQELEHQIIGYCDEYEKITPNLRGYAELLLLRSLDMTRRSRRAQLRIEELERKLPWASDSIVQEEMTGMSKMVGSPIPQSAAEKMTDDQWISAMQKYADESRSSLRGGPHELSSMLADFARQDRHRFARLISKMPETVQPFYFSAILNGLSSNYGNLNEEEKAR